MKYWNKDKEIRKRCWTPVTLEPKHVKTRFSNGTTAWFPEFLPNSEIKRWCQHQKSNGKFYNYQFSETWWFELPQDATWFTLKWA